jgi:RNA polymerase sigma-70 factor, ECF subfamily
LPIKARRVSADLRFGSVDDAQVIVESVNDPSRFAELYERYARLLYRYAYRRLGDHRAEDAVADTFVAAFRARGRYDPTRADAKPWLFAIVSHEIARYRRTEQAHYRALLRIKHDQGEEDLADRVVSSATAQATRRSLLTALAGLHRKERDVLLLIAWGDLSYEEVAQALGIPVGTVRSRLNRARRKVREALPHHDIEETHE